MAGSVNKVIVVGNLGADPEIRELNGEQRVANLRVATSDTWTDRSTNEKRERTQWHTVAVFNQASVTYAERYLMKGSRVYVEGKLQTRKWQDQSGEDRYSTEIIVNAIGGRLEGLSGQKEGRIENEAPNSAPISDFDPGDIPF